MKWFKIEWNVYRTLDPLAVLHLDNRLFVSSFPCIAPLFMSENDIYVDVKKNFNRNKNSWSQGYKIQ